MIRLCEIKKKFGQIEVLKNISFFFKSGRRYAIIGPNNCGKSTLLYLISGYYKQDSGNILIENGIEKSINNYSVFQRAQIGIGLAFQDPRGYPELSVYDNLALCMMEFNSDNIIQNGKTNLKDNIKYNDKIENMLRIGKLLDFKFEKVSNLSYGQRKVLDVLFLIARKSKIIMLDEPFAGVDPNTLDTLLKLFIFNKESKEEDQNKIYIEETLIIVSHEISIVSDIVDEVVLINNGNIVLTGKPFEVLNSEIFKNIYLL